MDRLHYDSSNRTVTFPIIRDKRTVIMTIPQVTHLVVENPFHCDRVPLQQGCLFVDTSLHGQMFVCASEDVYPDDASSLPMATVLIYIDSDEITEEQA
jgi:hypothetical protein